jgi:hypothetical protein
MINFKIFYSDKNPQEVEILFDKNLQKYRYVNLTKGHICKCTFASELDAIKDLRKYPNITGILSTASSKKSVEDFIITFEGKL